MKRALIFYTDSGKGHNMTANTIAKQLALTSDIRCDVVEIYRDLLRDVDPFRIVFGISGPEIYNNIVLKRGHTGWFWLLFSACSIALIRFLEPLARSRLDRLFRAVRPDVVISVMPLANRAIATAILTSQIKAPFLTVITDFAETASGTWIQHPSQHLICGTKKAIAQATNSRVPSHHIHAIPGVVVSNDFGCTLDPAVLTHLRESLQLSADLKIGIMIFGGYGVSRMETYARMVEERALPVQMIYICGDNPGLAHRLTLIRKRRPRVVLALTDDVARLMALSSFVVTKPGPGTIAEAVRANVPLIVELNRHTLLQERYNARWVVENAVGLSFRSSQDLLCRLKAILAPENADAIRRSAHELTNSRSSLDEACLIVQRIVKESRP